MNPIPRPNFPSTPRGALRAPGALALLVAAACGGGDATTPVVHSSLAPRTASAEPLAFAWPPRRGEAYPNVTLRDHRGALVELASFRGKVLLIEPIGMT